MAFRKKQNLEKKCKISLHFSMLIHFQKNVSKFKNGRQSGSGQRLLSHSLVSTRGVDVPAQSGTHCAKGRLSALSRKEQRIGSPKNREAPPNEIYPSWAGAAFSLF